MEREEVSNSRGGDRRSLASKWSEQGEERPREADSEERGKKKDPRERMS